MSISIQRKEKKGPSKDYRISPRWEFTLVNPLQFNNDDHSRHGKGQLFFPSEYPPTKSPYSLKDLYELVVGG